MLPWLPLRVQHNAAVPFELPHLPHLTPDEVVRFKEQVREREEHMEKTRKEAAEAEAASLCAQREACFCAARACAAHSCPWVTTIIRLPPLLPPLPPTLPPL